MYVVGIATSPRRNSNTETLLDALLRAVRGNDIRVEKIRITGLQISPCRACEACFKTGRCVISDDASGIYEKLLKADRMILASPVFFLTVNAQTKALMDRGQFLWARKYVLRDQAQTSSLPSRRMGYTIMVGGTHGKKLFECAVRVVKCFYDTLSAEYGGGLFFRGIEKAGEILEHPDALRQAQRAARAVIEGAKLLNPMGQRLE